MANEASLPTTDDVTDQEDSVGILGRIVGTSFMGQVIRGTLVPILIYVVLFALAIWRAMVDPEGSAAYFAYLRDLLTILLSLTLILVFIATGVLIVQVARFVNLLRSEVKPITQDTREAIKNVRVTSQFVQKQAAEPIIRSQAFLFGLITFLREIVRISRILRRRDDDGGDVTDAE